MNLSAALKEVVINQEHDPEAKQIIDDIMSFKFEPVRSTIDIADLLGGFFTSETINEIEEYIKGDRNEKSQSAGNTKALA